MNAVATRAQKIVVGIAEIRVATQDGDELVTYALGSCLGLAVYDPVAHVGGLLHAMLPDLTCAPHKAGHPAMFVDDGVAELLRLCTEQGAQKDRLVVKAAGGAAMSQGPQSAGRIGDRNVTSLRRALWKAGLLLTAKDLGGTLSRTLTLRMSDGSVTVSGEGGVRKL
jgi:chemotaxis protein CheD